jgi:hypothetical protein
VHTLLLPVDGESWVIRGYPRRRIGRWIRTVGLMGRPLHAVFTELLNDEATRQAYAADPGSLLDGAGHTGLPDELVAEAVVSFVDTAPPAVAEHLAPFVMARGPVAESDADPAELDGLALLATAPPQTTREELDGDLAATPESMDEAHTGTGWSSDDLDFGTGSERELTDAPADGFDDALSEIPAASAEPAEPAPAEDEHLLGPDPAFAVDETETAEDLDAE